MKENLMKAVVNSRNYTLQTAELMPQENYHTKLTTVNWDFGELIDHIAYGVQWWIDNYVLGNETDWNPPAPAKDKVTVMKRLQTAFDRLEQTVDGLTSKPEALHGVYATLDHVTHHRGQCVLFLRQQGIEPPEYTY